MQSILLLHGAIGASTQLKGLADVLADSYKVYTLDFTGHGGRPGNDAPFSIALFAGDVLQFMENERLDKVSIFGYSMGGYVAMYLALHHPEKIEKVITMATKYTWDEAIAAKEVLMLNPEKIEQKLPAFAATLAKMHAPNDWKLLLHKTAAMMTAMGNDNPLKPTDYPAIAAPVLLLIGDRDKMITLDETLAVYRALRAAAMGILPSTGHPVEQADTGQLATMIKRFLA